MKLTSTSELDAKSFQINRSSLLEYANASGDQNPIHQNEDFAKSVGLPDVIAHGMLTMGLGATFLTEIFGQENIKEYCVRFVKPVVVAAEKEVIVNFSAKVSEVSESEVKIDITCTVDDVKVLGKAFAIVKN